MQILELSLPLPPPLNSRAGLSLRRFGFEFGKIVSKYFMEDANIGAVTASSSVEQPSGFVSKELSTTERTTK